ncbi:hypothetical protein EB796_021024 [Bugula neritina]|uniref:Uncharacterized protein n=1 Tax=Bugula neritina TaxID=10212 RepID=A0A7J7J4K6_BUGNE|nr:hypothetical protein EB796_021024 [Bugula neritina]
MLLAAKLNGTQRKVTLAQSNIDLRLFIAYVGTLVDMTGNAGIGLSVHIWILSKHCHTGLYTLMYYKLSQILIYHKNHKPTNVTQVILLQLANYSSMTSSV